jgi:Spy/CpxP family protein refolding chaperone
MKSRKSRLVVGLCLVLLGILLALPMSGLAKEGHGGKYKEFRAQMMKNLNLSPEQAKQFKELEEKFVKERMELYGQLNKDMADLEKAAAEKPPIEAKVQEKVNAIIGVKDKLWANYQDWWHGEMKVLKPEQQARYLMDMSKWWNEVMAGRYKHEEGKPERK